MDELKRHNFFTHVDLHGNKIFGAKVDDIDENADSDSAVNKLYVDEQTTVNTLISDDLITARNNVGGLVEGETVDGLTYKELLDKILFGVVDPLYTLPTFTLSFSDLYKNTYFEVGTDVSVEFNYTLTNNDSGGVQLTTPYSYQINNSTEIDHNTNPYTYIYDVDEGENKINAKLRYLESVDKTDNTGEINIINSFADGELILEDIDFVIGVWPTYKLSNIVEENFILNNNGIRTTDLYTNGKNTISNIDYNDRIVLYANANDIQFSFLIPKPSDYSNRIIRILKDSFDITSVFTISDVVMNDFNETGRTKDYILITSTFDGAISSNSVFELLIQNKL